MKNKFLIFCFLTVFSFTAFSDTNIAMMSQADLNHIKSHKENDLGISSLIYKSGSKVLDINILSSSVIRSIHLCNKFKMSYDDGQNCTVADRILHESDMQDKFIQVHVHDKKYVAFGVISGYGVNKVHYVFLPLSSVQFDGIQLF